jgi:putative flippase GtrA
MSVLTIGRVSQHGAHPGGEVSPDASVGSFRKKAAWPIADWRSILSDKPADNPLVEFLRYGIASAVALVCDFVTLVSLTEFARIHYLIAAALGFSVGVFVAYALSVRWVFRRRRLANASAEGVFFILIGAAGLVLNQIIMFGLTELALLPYAFSKLASVGVVFTANFTLRKLVLFTGAAAAGD